MEHIQFFRGGEEAAKFCREVKGVKYSKPSARRLKMSRYLFYAIKAGLSEEETVANNYVAVWNDQQREEGS